MSNKREIAKTPEMPFLNPQIIEMLTQLCFRADDHTIPPVDCIFVFGTAISFKELALSLKQLIEKNVNSTILITGGIEAYEDSMPAVRSEAERIFEEIKAFVPKTTQVILEKKSQNTLENVVFGLELLPKMPSSLCFIGKSFHMGRAYLTLRKYLPNAKLYQHGYNTVYPGITSPISRDNWFLFPEFSARVWGEFIRINTYGKRGDIHFDEVKELVEEFNQTM